VVLLRLGIVTLLLATATVPQSCSTREKPPPNIVVILADAMRADSLQVDDPTVLPFFRSLAEQSTVFTKAYSNSSWTSPSVASLFTSRYASQHHIVTLRSRLADEEIRLAESLKEGGYRTAALTTNLLVGSPGFQKGFDYFEYIVPVGDEAKSRAPALQERLAIWLSAPAADAAKPLFLYLHYLEPHVPYQPPLSAMAVARKIRPRKGDAATIDPRLLGVGPDGRQEDLRDLYAAEIIDLDRSLDALFGILKRTGVLDDAVVVFVADHGEEFLEHDIIGHGNSLFDKVIHIPFMIHLPGQLTTVLESRPVSLVDVAPTLLELAGIPTPATFEGESLKPHLGGGFWPELGRWVDRTLELMPWTAGPHAYSELFPVSKDTPSSPSSHRRAMMDSRYKAVSSADESLRVYDLERDPMEQTALPPDPYPVADLLRRFAPRAGVTDPPDTEPQLDDRTRERLRALGYTEN